MENYKFIKDEKVIMNHKITDERDRGIYTIRSIDCGWVRLENSSQIMNAYIPDNWVKPLTIESFKKSNFILKVKNSELNELVGILYNVARLEISMEKETSYLYSVSDKIITMGLPITISTPIVDFQVFKYNLEFLKIQNIKQESYTSLAKSCIINFLPRFERGSVITHEKLKEIGFKTGDIIYTLDSEDKRIEEWIILNNLAYNKEANTSCNSDILLGCKNMLYIHPIDFINKDFEPITIDTNVVVTIKY